MKKKFLKNRILLDTFYTYGALKIEKLKFLKTHTHTEIYQTIK